MLTARLHKHSISPTLPSSSVLVRSIAAPINPADINTIQGFYPSQPSKGTLLGTNEPSAVPGNEGAFEVVAVGGSTSAFKKGDWAIPAKSQIGTWRTHAVLDASDLIKVDKEGLTPTQLATVSVNPCTAYSILRSQGPRIPSSVSGAMRPLEVNSGEWFIQNGANSGVGRAAIQFGNFWGLRSINVIRERPTPEETAALKAELTTLGADVVITETELYDAGWKERLAEITRGGRDTVGLALNCTSGKAGTAIAKALSEGGTVVTYGAMSMKPLLAPAGMQIWKDIRFLGFWLSRWNEHNPEGRRHMVGDILDMIRGGRFKDVPTEELVWNWETKEADLREAVGKGMSGFRNRKGVFVFQDT